MKVFTDANHHHDLLYSFELAFPNSTIFYLPIGYDWGDYWQLSNEQPVRDAYLSTETGKARQVLEPYWEYRSPSWARYALEMLRIGSILDNGNCYLVEDLSKENVWRRAITLEQFKSKKFDIILATLPQHIPIYKELIRLYQPQAKLIVHSSPLWPFPDCNNIIFNSIHPELGNHPEVNWVDIHQEFDTDIFYPSFDQGSGINCYVHFPETDYYINKLDLNVFFIGKTLGSLDNVLVSTADIARSIREAKAVLHIKPGGGENYGHIPYNAFATGTPLITRISDFKGLMLEEMLIDGWNCVDVENKTKQEVIECLDDIKREHVYQTFIDKVNFQTDCIKLKQFLDRSNK